MGTRSLFFFFVGLSLFIFTARHRVNILDARMLAWCAAITHVNLFLNSIYGMFTVATNEEGKRNCSSVFFLRSCFGDNLRKPGVEIIYRFSVQPQKALPCEPSPSKKNEINKFRSNCNVAMRSCFLFPLCIFIFRCIWLKQLNHSNK